MNFQKELDIIIPVIMQAGEVLLKYFHKGEYNIKEKKKNDPVTEADFASNEILQKALKKYFPNDAILSEESAEINTREQMDNKRKNAERIWIIDPLDGTKEFISKNPEFCISVGLVLGHEPVLGIIYNPAKDFLIHGGKFDKVKYNEKKVEPINPSFKNLKICISRTEMSKGYFNDLKSKFKINQDNIIGSIAYKLALVAKGDYDLIISRKPKSEWDIAAAMGIFSGLGHVLLNHEFKPILLNQENFNLKGLIGGSYKSIKYYKKLMNTNHV